MEGFWNWVTDHWFLGFILMCLMICVVDSLLANGFRTVMFIWNRSLRTLKVCVRGWPPEHLDADGDWKK